MNITTKFIVIIAVNLLPAYLIAQRGRGRIYNGKEPDLGPLDLEQCLIGAGLILAGYLVYKVTSDSESGFGITLSIILWIAGLLLNINLISLVFSIIGGLYAIGFGIIILIGIYGLVTSSLKGKEEK